MNSLVINYLRIHKNGTLEYADSHFSFWQNDDVRCFGYVPLVGLAWQFLFLTKRILVEVGFVGGVRFSVNLVGTRDTILSDFATGAGENANKWQDPFAMSAFSRIRNRALDPCQDLNLKMEYVVALHNLTEENSFKIIKDLGQQLALAYNIPGSPRCFNYNTDVFPWQQYLNNIHQLGG